jgi:hypothetical protein
MNDGGAGDLVLRARSKLGELLDHDDLVTTFR